jgi:methylated-DNA-protein-cysteine methyltransferase-like protein
MIEKCTARMVGYAMSSCPANQNIPWHRVINSQGKISIRSNGEADPLQKVLLEEEGVIFNEKFKIQLDKYIWNFG